jgi:hypothetical protein
MEGQKTKGDKRQKESGPILFGTAFAPGATGEGFDSPVRGGTHHEKSHISRPTHWRPKATASGTQIHPSFGSRASVVSQGWRIKVWT